MCSFVFDWFVVNCLICVLGCLHACLFDALFVYGLACSCVGLIVECVHLFARMICGLLACSFMCVFNWLCVRLLDRCCMLACLLLYWLFECLCVLVCFVCLILRLLA